MRQFSLNREQWKLVSNKLKFDNPKKIFIKGFSPSLNLHSVSFCAETKSRQKCQKFFIMKFLALLLFSIQSGIPIFTLFIQQQSFAAFVLLFLPVWPDWAIYWTLGNFLKPLATNDLPKSLTLFFIDVKSYHFSSEISFGQRLYTFGDFFLVTLLPTDQTTYPISTDERKARFYERGYNASFYLRIIFFSMDWNWRKNDWQCWDSN